MNSSIISILTGLGGMVGWGTSDFFGNSVTEKIGYLRAMFWPQIASLSALLIALLILRPSYDVPVSFLPLVFITGVGYAFGYLFYYKAFEVGTLSLASVVINLNAVFTMIAAYLFYGQRLYGLQIPGVILIFLGLIFVSINFEDLHKKRNLLFAGVKETLIASFLFGVLHWAITNYLVTHAHWLWIATENKVTALVLVFLTALVTKKPLAIPSVAKTLVQLIVITGILEGLAVLSVNYGFSVGEGILVAPIANSVSVVTVALALIFLKEKVTRLQATGMALTITGIILTGIK